MRIIQAQYDSWKDVLTSKFSGTDIVVDGVYTTIP